MKHYYVENDIDDNKMNENTIIVLSSKMFDYMSTIAVGCILPESPNILRVGQDGAIHRFHCNTTDERWSLECQDSAWIGEHPSCGSGQQQYQNSKRRGEK